METQKGDRTKREGLGQSPWDLREHLPRRKGFQWFLFLVLTLLAVLSVGTLSTEEGLQPFSSDTAGCVFFRTYTHTLFCKSPGKVMVSLRTQVYE